MTHSVIVKKNKIVCFAKMWKPPLMHETSTSFSVVSLFVSYNHLIINYNSVIAILHLLMSQTQQILANTYSCC